MNCLSSELILLIVSALEEEDVPNFRLVSSLFARHGIEYLKIKKNFCMRKHSLDRLHSVATHPILCRNLPEIVFFVEIVPPYERQEDWEDQAEAICSRDNGKDNLATQWLKIYSLNQSVQVDEIEEESFRLSGWNLHQSVRQEQEELLDPTSMCFENLQKDLALLRNLTSFELATVETIESCPTRFLTIMNKHQEWYCWNNYCSLDSFRAVSRNLVHALLSREISQDSMTGRLRSLTAFSSAFLSHDLRELDISTWDHNLRHLQVLKLTAAGEEELDTTFQENEDSDPDCIYPGVDVDERAAIILPRIMSRIQDLQSLEFTLPNQSYIPHTQFIFPVQTWPNLTCLTFSTMYLDFTNFKSFLSSNAESLREIRLGHMGLGSTDVNEQFLWLELAKFLQTDLHLSDLGLWWSCYEGGKRFGVQRAHVLASGVEVRVWQMTLFLVCGKWPYNLPDSEHPDREEFARLGWKDLMIAYT